MAWFNVVGGTKVPGVRLKLQASLFLLMGSAMPLWSAAAQSGPVPPVTELVRRSVVANTGDWKVQPEYSYRDLEAKGKVDSSGQQNTQASKTYEVRMIAGSPYEQMVEIDGEPLNREQQQVEAAKLERETRRRQNESPAERQARLAKYQNDRAEEHLLMQQMVAAFDFRYVGEQQVNGADCYVLDALPKPDYRPPVEKARVLMGMKGRLWIEKSGFHWARVQAEVFKPVEFGLFIAKVKPGTSFELEQTPVGPVWLPSRFIETVNASVLGLYGMRTREESHFSNYRRMQLDAAVEKLPVAQR